MGIHDALDLAYEKKLDLVLVAPNAEIPVCKIMNYGKYKFEQSKKEKEAKKKQKIFEIKESFAKDIEEARAKKEIGSALDAQITIYATEDEFDFINNNKQEIALVAIISELNVEKSDKHKVLVEKSTGVKCPRCWTYSHEFSDEGICMKCHKNM